jgi:tricorn protease
VRRRKDGVGRDIEVEMTPKVIASRDSQLERAVQEALKLLEKQPFVCRAEPTAPVLWARTRGGGNE